MKNVFIVSSVGGSQEYMEKVEAYADELEAKGASVFLPARDCISFDADLKGLAQVRKELTRATEVHIFHPDDTATEPDEYTFDMGMIIQANKPVRLIYPAGEYCFGTLLELLAKHHSMYFLTPIQRLKLSAAKIRSEIYGVSADEVIHEEWPDEEMDPVNDDMPDIDSLTPEPEEVIESAPVVEKKMVADPIRKVDVKAVPEKKVFVNDEDMQPKDEERTIEKDLLGAVKFKQDKVTTIKK